MKITVGMSLTVVIVFTLVLSTLPEDAQAATLTSYDDNKPGFDAAVAGKSSVELDFDELANFAEVTDVYSDLGVTFSAKSCIGYMSGVHPDHPTVRAYAGSLSDSNPVSYDNGVGVPWDSISYSVLYVDFTSPVSFFGAYFIDNGAPLTVTLYDVCDNVIGTPVISAGGEVGDSGEWWGVVADETVIAGADVTAQSKADFFGFDDFVFEEGTIQGESDMKPGKLNLKSKGKWVTCHIELPEGSDAGDIDVETVRISEVGGELASPIYAEDHPTSVGDWDDDGVADLMVKFDRGDLIDAMEEFGDEDEITMVIDGALDDGTPFECKGQWVESGKGWSFTL